MKRKQYGIDFICVWRNILMAMVSIFFTGIFTNFVPLYRRRLVKRKQYGKLLMEVDESIRAMEKKQGRGRKMKKEQKKGIEQSPGKSKERYSSVMFEHTSH